MLADILRRDERDSSRAVAPLKPAPDAHLLDTTAMNADAAFQAAVDLIERQRTAFKSLDAASARRCRTPSRRFIASRIRIVVRAPISTSVKKCAPAAHPQRADRPR